MDRTDLDQHQCGTPNRSTGSDTLDDHPGRTSSHTIGPARQFAAIVALSLGIAMLVAAEFLPASVLPIIAGDLQVSTGMAGLTVASTALAGALTAPTISSVIGRTNRRTVLLVLLGLAIVANLLVAIAPHFMVLLLGRLVLGVAIAGYWSLAFGVGVQVAPGRPALVSTALATGTSVATIVAVPLASLLGDVAGWRTVFWIATGLTVLTTAVLAAVLPGVRAQPGAGLTMMRLALRRRRLMVGVLFVGLVAFANFLAYPYIRVLIERVSPGATAALLLAWGIGGLLGNFAAGYLSRWLRMAVTIGPVLLMGSLAVLSTTSSPVLLAVAVIGWGIGFNFVPVTTQLWVSTVEPARAEAAVALQVTAFQTAITIGSALGGLLLDRVGLGTALLVGAVAAALAAIGFASLRVRPATS